MRCENRCSNCEYVKEIEAHDHYKYAGCFKKPYTYNGESVWEIKTCPIGKGTIEIPNYLKQDRTSTK